MCWLCLTDITSVVCCLLFYVLLLVGIFEDCLLLLSLSLFGIEDGLWLFVNWLTIYIWFYCLLVFRFWSTTCCCSLLVVCLVLRVVWSDFVYLSCLCFDFDVTLVIVCVDLVVFYCCILFMWVFGFACIWVWVYKCGCFSLLFCCILIDGVACYCIILLLITLWCLRL